ncbi:ABC transporter permease [Candidatus Uhrbacteria bacterium]|nr:ABC transporter permease [Candidatus Uhrbacteria bacterium]
MIGLVFRNFQYRRRRTALTVLGISLGSTLIVSFLLLGQGLETAVAERMRSFGSDLIFVFPGKENNPFAGMFGGSELRDKDVDALKSVEGIRIVLPMQTRTLKAALDGEEKAILIHGSPWMETEILYRESQGFGIAEGYWPTREDAKEVVAGSTAAAWRFRRPLTVSDELVIRGRRYRVAGIFKPTGDAANDAMIYFSQREFRRLTGDTTGVRAIILKVGTGYDLNAVADSAKATLSRQRGIGDFAILTPDKALRLVGNVLDTVRIVLGGLAAVALLVGGVGVMNTMFTAVLERTREIGIMKALGAAESKILTMFLLEAGLYGATGGVIGSLASLAIAKVAEAASGATGGLALLSVEIDPLVILGSLSFTFVLGALFGVVPAWQAARLLPTEALRYE